MASPDFSINGFPLNEMAIVAAGSPVVATLDSTVGVGVVDWRIDRTDDTTTPATYDPIVVSGALNEVATVTSAGPGTAGEMTVRINNGRGPNGETDLSATERKVKWVVLADGGGEVGVQGEQERENRLSSPTHGLIALINANLRKAGAGAFGTTILGGVFGRQQTDLASWVDVGAIVIDLSSTPTAGRVVELLVVLSTNNAAIDAQVQILNRTTTMVVANSLLTTPATTPVLLAATITPDATFDDTAVQLLSVQVQKAAAGAPTDIAALDFAQMRVRYT